MTVSGLKPYQSIIEAETLYSVNAAASSSSAQAAEQLQPNIQVYGNSAHVYGSQVQPDSAPAGMTKIFDSLLNIKAFSYVPNFLYIDPVGADPDAIVLTGINAEEV